MDGSQLPRIHGPAACQGAGPRQAGVNPRGAGPKKQALLMEGHRRRTQFSAVRFDLATSSRPHIDALWFSDVAVVLESGRLTRAATLLTKEPGSSCRGGGKVASSRGPRCPALGSTPVALRGAGSPQPVLMATPAVSSEVRDAPAETRDTVILAGAGHWALPHRTPCPSLTVLP